MQKTSKIWFNGKFVNWDDAKIHLVNHTLHYGSGVFEGIRFYNTPKGPAVFRLQEHVERLFTSAKVFKMSLPYSKQEIFRVILETIKINKISDGYIRPIIFFGYGNMVLNPKENPVEIAIAVWPWPPYLGEKAISVKISKYIRIHPESLVADSKITGHYVNSILPTLEAEEYGYDECLLLDYKGNIAEGPGENFFIVNNKKIITPKLGTILPGITRDAVMEIAKDLGYKVEEKIIKPSDAKNADECFFTGTAAEIKAIKKIDNKIIGNGDIGPITKKLKDMFMDIVHGKNKKYEKWLSYIR